MLRRFGAIGLAAASLSIAACTTAPAGGLTADGCTPSRSIYQPGVGGGPGTILNLPGNCPRSAPTVLATAQSASPVAPTEPPGPVPPRPEPVALPSAQAAIRNGVERLCAWLYSGADYSLPSLQQTALEAGFRRGSSVNIVPLPEMLQQPSFSALGFQAKIENAPPEGSGVAAFASFHDPVCQVQVYNYRQDGERFLAQLAAAGWTKVGGTTTPSTNVAADR